MAIRLPRRCTISPKPYLFSEMLLTHFVMASAPCPDQAASGLSAAAGPPAGLAAAACLWRSAAAAHGSIHPFPLPLRLAVHHSPRDVRLRVSQIRRPAAFIASIPQCAPTARITSGGGFHPESCRLLR